MIILGLLLNFILIINSYASEEFVVKNVLIENSNLSDSDYKARNKKLLNLKGQYRSLVHLRETIKILSSDGGFKYFEYKILKNIEGVLDIEINYELKPVLNELKFNVDHHIDTDLKDLVSINKGSYLDEDQIKSELLILQRKIDNLGFPQNSVKYSIQRLNGNFDIIFDVKLGRPLIFKKILTNTNSLFIKSFLKNKFLNLYNHPFDFNKFKQAVDDAKKELFNYGYYLINLDATPKINNNLIALDIKVTNDELFVFNFKSLDSNEKDIYLEVMTNSFKQFKKKLTKAMVADALNEFLKKRGIFNPEIKVSESEFQNKFNEKVLSYEIVLLEGTRTKVSKIYFTGNYFFNESDLVTNYDKQSFELAKHGFLDTEYLDYFKDFLRNLYLKNGFVQVSVDDPVINFNPDLSEASIEFKIKEGPQAFVKKIKFKGLPFGYEETILKIISNAENKSFDPLAFSEDLKIITNYLRNEGFYFAEIQNQYSDNLVQFSENNSEVEINIQVVPGQKILLNRLLFVGNNKTRRKILMRKIFLKSGDTITPDKTKRIEAIISSTGLFSSVVATPVKHSSKKSETDLIVKVVERDYGLVEFAPGFRTDLGLKLSGSVSYLNLAGDNKSIALRSQVNQRLNYQTFDPRRRKARRQFLEHNTSLNFNQNDLFDTYVNLGLGSSFQRKRFYSFDADIWRVNSTLTREITEDLSASLRYQWETIAQSDATEERDNGSFQIGAITPSLTYDKRNSEINPTKGSFLNLSCEFANPYFLSQDTSELKINYYKLISRNRLYLPYRNGALALSFVGGLQENLATDKRLDTEGNLVSEGYIPNIKVFRLTGMDIVRGFNDEEINRLPDKQDISEVRVDQRAYLINMKIEPRFFLTDNIVGGVFYDAGRVSVNSLDFGDLRDSVGVTFKILTPVGTLDFDYGIKLLRKTNQDGTLEDPGRFHVSIGFF